MIRIAPPLLSLVMFVMACSVRTNNPVSPNGEIRIEVDLNNNKVLTYAVLKGEEMLLKPSVFKLEFQDQPAFGEHLSIELVSESTVDERWNPVWGKTEQVRNHYNEYIPVNRGGRYGPVPGSGIQIVR